MIDSIIENDFLCVAGAANNCVTTLEHCNETCLSLIEEDESHAEFIEAYGRNE